MGGEKVQLEPGERVILKLRPSWRSFLVWYVAIFLLVSGPIKEERAPYVGKTYPLKAVASYGLAALCLAYVFYKRYGAEFIITDRKVVRTSAVGLTQDLELARIDSVKTYESLTARALGTGKLYVEDSKDPGSGIQFFGVEEPKRLKERIEGLVRQAKLHK